MDVRAPKTTAPWEWRRPSAGVSPGQTGIDVFHAYDVNNNAACEPVYGLVESRDEPNEGSELCDACIVVVSATPAGRDKR